MASRLPLSLCRRAAATARLRPVAVSLARSLSSQQQHFSSVFSSSSRSYTAAVAQEDEEPYVSPLQELFDRMENDGPTTLGTTEYVPAENKTLKCGLPESALRFTTTSFGRTMMAPHVHPNEHRVVMKVNSNKLPLNALEKEILREIVGNRLNDERNELRLTSNQFGSRIENKRHLVSMLDRILLSCQRLAKEIQQEQEQQQQDAQQPQGTQPQAM